MYKKFIIFTLCTFLSFVVLHLSLLIVVDPLAIFNFGIVKKEFYVKEMRFQAAGVIRSYDFDSAIVGTSMAENFDANETSKILGGQFLNLSLSGSLLEERKVVLNYIIDQHQVKDLIISFDGATKLQRNQGIPISNWSFLYDTNYLDDIVVYTSNKYMSFANCHSLFNGQMYRLILGDCPTEKIRPDVYSLTEWYSDPSKSDRFGGLQYWLSNKNNLQMKSIIDKILKSDERRKTGRVIPVEDRFNLHNFDEVEENLIPLIQQNPEVRFILFFPPYSLLNYAMEQQTNNYQFENYKSFVKKAALEMEKYPNVQLHWFNDQDFILNIENYKDLLHYHPRYQALFLEHFRDNESIINAENYQTKLADLESKARQFDFDEVVRILQE